MNYRHGFHAGGVADVVKHALMLVLMRRYLGKDAPFMMLDSHAGAGVYDLAGAEAQKTAEASLGFAKLIHRPHLPPILQRLNDVANIMAAKFAPDGGGGGPFYPGSAMLAGMEKRPHDRLILCEKHPEECQKLRQNLRRLGLANVAVHERDGYEAMRAFLPPPEQRGLIFIDPPYETETEERDVITAVAMGLKKFPQGCFVVWFPIKNLAWHQRFLAEFKHLAAKSVLVAAMEHAALNAVHEKSTLNAAGKKTLHAPAIPGKTHEKMIGSGLVVVNPPWQIESEFSALGQAIMTLLGLPAARFSCHWLLTEQN
ncbi:MAG: 23S rRNA (adenine(2030)-N(6))-methyltransferase RlmJ [Candidatus Symbiobacter sp.]|nr:23S rRNA (adenine(2030)-N(6))-methyltransferase RlmJ [Candidatus Symbiobacter sp.]